MDLNFQLKFRKIQKLSIYNSEEVALLLIYKLYRQRLNLDLFYLTITNHLLFYKFPTLPSMQLK